MNVAETVAGIVAANLADVRAIEETVRRSYERLAAAKDAAIAEMMAAPVPMPFTVTVT